MPVRLYFDVHVDKAIHDQLRLRGVDVLRAQDDGTAERSDEELLRRTTELGRLIFTQDLRFKGPRSGKGTPGILGLVIWQPIGRDRRGLRQRLGIDRKGNGTYGVGKYRPLLAVSIAELPRFRMPSIARLGYGRASVSSHASTTLYR